MHARHLTAGCCGFAVVPAAIVAAFAWQGALAPFFYGTVLHNALPGLGLWQRAPWRIALLPLSVLPLWAIAALAGGVAPTSGLAVRRVLVLLSTGISAVLLAGTWPLITREDVIPLSPLLALLLTPVMLVLPGVARCAEVRWVSVPLLVVVLELGGILHTASPLADHARQQAALVASVLQITGPDDYVMDLKGEAVFRRRPYYFVLENITKVRLRRGLLADTIPEDLIATRTPVVLGDRNGFPPRGRAFMEENYLPIGSLRVLGHVLVPKDAGDPRIRFEVVVPERYAIVAEHGGVGGSLDGTAYDGARVLAPGVHEFRPDSPGVRFAVVWAQAAEHGWSPFSPEGTAS
jgi:hypothetical protein